RALTELAQKLHQRLRVDLAFGGLGGRGGAAARDATALERGQKRGRGGLADAEQRLARGRTHVVASQRRNQGQDGGPRRNGAQSQRGPCPQRLDPAHKQTLERRLGDVRAQAAQCVHGRRPHLLGRVTKQANQGRGSLHVPQVSDGLGGRRAHLARGVAQ